MVHLVGKGVDDERDMLGGNALYGLLDHMVTILVLDASQDLVLKLLDEVCLLINEDVLESLNGQRCRFQM